MLSRKPRTKLKKWLDRHGIEQQELAKAAKVSTNTITRACRDISYIPKPEIMKKILRIVRKKDPYMKVTDLWDWDM
ncbi:helix-turn-helix domain-containing protein [Ectobacillus panaciterrae]|uniref:helix-turn-helix domain-containing protein n=1 Tax=Ectobacillus panaciterrae TaxID=363872 RepID=UPI00041FD69D|nr:helix-turn-helix transcriptional regulator [Ectobacillus panaciterrae]